jgi:pimeloyl-ACP methyl ester carboxylesterase
MRPTLPGRYGLNVTSYRQPGTVLTDHVFAVPLDHSVPDGEQIEVFAREVVAADRQDADLPWLLFLQGGPGHGAQRPVGRESWLDRALDDYRVLLLDQRGTGRSSPASRQTLARLGSAKAQAGYLAHFRADAIVLDAELIRRDLTGGAPWSVLGQSFGGFCTVSYLSFAPHGISEAFITGGLPGLTATADDVYRRTYPAVAAKNAAHYERYPEDLERARLIAQHLASHDVRLPDGAPLSVPAFQSLGNMLGSGTGSHELHYLLEDPFAGDELSDAFLYKVQARTSFAGTPLYALLHEPCYAQGTATRWSAQRIRAEFGEFDPGPVVESDASTAPLLFTGEMIYPWMVDADPVLRPLREAADLIACWDDWPPLYDPARLAANDVPVTAAVYYNDMYVDREFSIRTAQAIRGLRTWVTSEYEHDGLRVSSGKVLDHLIAMSRGNL